MTKLETSAASSSSSPVASQPPVAGQPQTGAQVNTSDPTPGTVSPAVPTASATLSPQATMFLVSLTVLLTFLVLTFVVTHLDVIAFVFLVSLLGGCLYTLGVGKGWVRGLRVGAALKAGFEELRKQP